MYCILFCFVFEEKLFINIPLQQWPIVQKIKHKLIYKVFIKQKKMWKVAI